ncbi:GPI transamidase component PIG-T [Glycine max]|nr:GPI transamidase component PIG-T [Glycine max]
MTLNHSQRLHLTMSTDHSDGSRLGINLEQTVTVVLQPNEQKAGPEDFRRNAGFELSVTSKRVHAEMKTSSSILYEYPIKEYTETEQFDLGLTWKHPIVWSSPHAPLYASRFSMGSGNERGAIAISLKSIQGLVAINNVKERCKLQANVLQIVPWYVKVYYHTLQLVVDERLQALTDFVERMHVSPSEDKVSPWVMEMILQFPCEMKSAVLSIVFDKGFLHIDEYPPDVNQGFDIPSAIISFPDFHAGLQFSNKSRSKSPLLSKLQEKSLVLSYTELLLVPLMTPDFSTPYNVITITCTVFALYFGSLLNVLRRGAKTFEKQRGRPLESSLPSPSSSSFVSPKLILRVLLHTSCLCPLFSMPTCYVLGEETTFPSTLVFHIYLAQDTIIQLLLWILCLFFPEVWFSLLTLYSYDFVLLLWIEAATVQKYHIKAMKLSFTQGRWNYERWGGFDSISCNNAKPPGVELWAVSCASVNFLESSTTYSASELAFQSALGSLRYGTLPREIEKVWVPLRDEIL